MLELLESLHWSLEPVASVKKDTIPGRKPVGVISLTSKQGTLQDARRSTMFTPTTLWYWSRDGPL